jgi:tRNA nucleotidyltransferase (CCA-adding enzyme)
MMIDKGVQVIHQLNENGFKAYLVGGCVRDLLLGRRIHDLDVCTDATPQQVAAVFKRAVLTGIKYGTVTVFSGETPVEVTTFRAESGYVKARRPKQVTFVSDLITDLSRRDFTINAIAMDGSGRLIDPFDGRQDIVKRCIRTVGPPGERFAEDALRMIRAVRFVGQLSFSIEPGTCQAMLRHRALLKSLSRERITQELDKIMDAAWPAESWRLLLETRYLSLFIGQKQLLVNRWEKIFGEIDGIEGREKRWVYLLAEGFTDEGRKSFVQWLRWSKRQKKKVLTMLDLVVNWQNDKAWLMRQLLYHGLDCMRAVLSIKKRCRDEALQSGDIDAVYRDMAIHSVHELAVNGRDLADRFNVPAGAWIGELLNVLVSQVLQQTLPNEKDALLAYAGRWLNDRYQT